MTEHEGVAMNAGEVLSWIQAQAVQLGGVSPRATIHSTLARLVADGTIRKVAAGQFMYMRERPTEASVGREF